MGHMFVELGVLLFGDFRLRPRPQCTGLIDGFVLVGRDGFSRVLIPLFGFHHDRQGDVVGIFSQNRAQTRIVSELILAFAQMQRHRGATLGFLDNLQRVVATAIGLPAHAVFGRKTGATRGQRDTVGHDKRGVETDAELSDQVGVFCRVASQFGQELTGSRARDGADIFNHFLPRHADAVVGNSHRACLRVKRNADLQFGVALKQRLVGQRLKAQFVAGVRCIGNQLAQENLLVAVQGVDHQLQQLLDLGLKAQRLFIGGFGHCDSGRLD